MLRTISSFCAFLAVVALSAHPTHQKKFSPLTDKEAESVVCNLRKGGLPDLGSHFEIKTTDSGKTQKVSGKLFFKNIADAQFLRIEIGDKVFLQNAQGAVTQELICPPYAFCADDVRLPFLLWDFKYLETRRVLGRNTHIIRFSSTKGTACGYSTIDVAYDPAFDAILQVEYLGLDKNNQLNKTDPITQNNLKVQRVFKLQDFKKISGMWLMKSVEIFENNQTTTINFTEVALNQILSDLLFLNTSPVNDAGLTFQKM